jgi:mannan endo-1,4-beta-mannosidase
LPFSAAEIGQPAPAACASLLSDGGDCVPAKPTGSRFTVSGRDILDPAGNAVLLPVVNKMSVFDDEDPTGTISFPEIAKTGANTVRIV